jgi:enamine deaminase RidA (YjgF/YER057c/UK114 family)
MTIGRAVVDGVSPVQTIHLIGHLATDAAGSGVGAQTREILHRIGNLLAQAGTDKSELIHANIWLRDLKSFAEMDAIWDGWMVPGRTPRRTTFEDRCLPRLCDVRIDVVAWRRTEGLPPSADIPG